MMISPGPKLVKKITSGTKAESRAWTWLYPPKKMEDLRLVGPVTEVSYSAKSGCEGLSNHQLENGMPT